MSLRSEISQVLANLHGCEFVSAAYLRKIMQETPEQVGQTQWAWRRIDTHGAFDESEARDMARRNGGTVLKRIVSFGEWQEVQSWNITVTEAAPE